MKKAIILIIILLSSPAFAWQTPSAVQFLEQMSEQTRQRTQRIQREAEQRKQRQQIQEMIDNQRKILNLQRQLQRERDTQKTRNFINRGW